LDSRSFDLWAGDYDETVEAADSDNLYPFAGYKILMNQIYGTVMNRKPASVLDIGIGTGVLANKLYEGGNRITGVDFSNAMLDTVRRKMPDIILIEYDFTKGLPPELKNTKFDFIISTYALHHLTDEDKIPFILSALSHLNENGLIIIGDVSFYTRSDLNECKNKSGDDWDGDEFYFVFSELNKALKNKCSLKYRQISYCSGILEISPPRNKAEDNELRHFLDSEGRLKSYPVKQKKKTSALRYLAEKFEPGKKYTEKEVNQLLNQWHTFDDCAVLRRDLYDSFYLRREANGSLYWLEEKQPAHMGDNAD
jgi:putative AdoMet-dependent methyltransferase